MGWFIGGWVLVLLILWVLMLLILIIFDTNDDEPRCP